MKILDLSAIYKLIDFYGENQQIIYSYKVFTLNSFLDYCEENNIEMSIYTYNVKSSGIYLHESLIVQVILDKLNQKDDILNL